jgi:MoxR-like ATPase
VKRYVRYGASVRATQFLTLAAKARALMAGRYHVNEDDLRALALPVLRHRVLTNYQAESDGVTVDKVLTDLVNGQLRGGGA